MNASANGHRPDTSLCHSFEPRDPLEVETPHGLGYVLYITVYGVHGNDMWCVANKEDGRLRHYETTQLRLAFNGVLGINKPLLRENPSALKSATSSRNGGAKRTPARAGG